MNADDACGYFERSGHCAGCGQPGNFCLCTPRRPCGCRELHDMGSGIGRSAVDVFGFDGAAVDFSERQPVPVSDDQAELF